MGALVDWSLPDVVIWYYVVPPCVETEGMPLGCRTIAAPITNAARILYHWTLGGIGGSELVVVIDTWRACLFTMRYAFVVLDGGGLR